MQKQSEKKTAQYSQSPYEEFSITYSPVKAGTYNIYLYGLIESAQQFVGAVEVLGAANDNDTVVIHLSTDGGSLEATDTLIQAMKESEAHIVVKCSGGVYSAGTLIVLEADEFTLSENASFLIHNGSCGSGGKYSDYILHTEHNKKYFERVMKSSYLGFLTEAEILDLMKGVDIWLDSESFAKRYQTRNEYFQYLSEVSIGKQPIKKISKPRVKKTVAIK